ncbi:MAG: pentapeptide repeat-containing protein [candidate division Zixibacteria bacterium]|nr:pentapeptide repeat-containing protein [candidate division Zixibacteria bacterium]
MAENKKKCQVRMWGGTSCGKELYDEEYCIFHSPKPDKDGGLFKKKLDEILNDTSTIFNDLSYFIFPKVIQFPREINKETIFMGSLFQGVADFTGSTFKDYANFSGATFQGEASFEVATFQKEIHFEGVTFNGVANFERTSIRQGVSFKSTVFNSEAYFGGAVFQILASFEKASFGRAANFENSFFQNGADFTGATFKNRTNFKEANFKEDAIFVGTKFKGKTSFENAVFQMEARFISAYFESEADFSGGFFQKEAFFANVIFQNKAGFARTTFQGQTKFVKNTFEFPVSFFRASFIEETTFSSAGEVIFPYNFSETILTLGEEDTKRVMFEKEVDFRNVKFLKPEKVSFRKVDLSKFRFLGTDLRKVEFVDVGWYKEKGRGRNKIYDEVSPDPGTKKFDYPLISQMYKRLRANYEDNLNYAEAGDFHIGEMEMRRKGEKNFFNKCIVWAYKLISNYGESYWRPLLCWILPILLLFPLLFMYSGIEQITSRQSPYMIHYQFNLSTISLSNAGDFIKDYLKSFVYSLSVFSLVREKLYRPISNLGHFWMVLESIFSPTLIAFFLLALRRRFKR